jgi:hypothetical protein
MRALVVAAEHMQPASAGLPHLPKGDRLLDWHARNSAKSHSQPEYGMRHRLTDWHSPAGLIRKVARAARQTALAHATSSGSDTLITIDASNTVLPRNVSLANLHETDFLIV